MSENLKTLSNRILKATSHKQRALALLEFAVRAPSTHNSQPWKFEITDKTIKVLPDMSLSLPKADPLGRDMAISLGCALENLVQASIYFGLFKQIEYGEKNDMIAELTLLDSVQIDANLKQTVTEILLWSNSRGYFLKEEVDESEYYQLENEFESDGISFILTTNSEKIDRIAELTAEAVKNAHSSRSFRREISNWMNTSLSKKKDGIPGYALRMPLIASFFIPTAIRWLDMSPVLAKKSGYALKTAPVIVTIHSKYENFPTWVKVGRLAQRIMLLAHAKNHNTSIYVGAIEIEKTRGAINQLFHPLDPPQFLFALGKIDQTHKQTPRHSVSSKTVI